MLHIMPLTSIKTQKQYFEKQSKKKQYFETLWGGPHGENKKTQENYSKKKQKQYVETLGWALHIPKTSGVF